MAARRATPDWKALLASWDEQQEAYHPEREHRFSAMFDVVEATVGRRFRALDLGSGPGSLSLRLLRRFPRARSVAVDYDPVTFTIGQHAVGRVGGRLTWIDAKLASPGWTDRLPGRRFDAALSTTALHWLTRPALQQLYRDVHRLLRPGGVFLNGDLLPWPAGRSPQSRIARAVRGVRKRRATGLSSSTAWERWWRRTAKIPALASAFELQHARHAEHPHEAPLPLREHETALRRAGFTLVEVLWQDIDDRVLFARR